MFGKILRNKKGASLIAALIIILVATVLSTALYGYANTQMTQAEIIEDIKQAEYLASSAIEATVKVYLETAQDFTGGNPTTTVPNIVETTYTYLLKNAIGPSGDQHYYTQSSDDKVVGVPENDPNTDLDDDNILGYYKVTVTYPVSEILNGVNIETINFKAEATYGGETVIDGSNVPTTTNGVTAIQEAYLLHSEDTVINALTEGWYSPTSGYAFYQNFNAPSSPPAKEDLELVYTDNSSTDLRIFGRRAADAIIFPPTNNTTFKVGSANVKYNGRDYLNETDMAFSAKTIHFQLPIDLSADDGVGKAYVLYLAARDIILDAPVTLFLERGLFSIRTSSAGTLMLSAPDGTSMRYTDPTRPSDGQIYAKVYFNGGVNIRLSSTFWRSYSKNIIRPGDVFYVKLETNSAGSTIGVDLLDWWQEEVSQTPQTIDFPDKNPPDWAVNLVEDLYIAAENEVSGSNNVQLGKLRKIDPVSEAADLIPPSISTTGTEERLIWK